jgi:hypothetical protein
MSKAMFVLSFNLVLQKTAFLRNVNRYGHLLLLRDLAGSSIFLSSNSFHNNTVEKGGALAIEFFTGDTLFTMTQNVIVNNFVQQGGGIFFFFFSANLNITKNTIANNQADLYGDSLASTPYQLIWIVPFDNTTAIYSGGRFSSFSLTAVDIFSTSTQPSRFNLDFLVASISTFGKTKDQGDGTIVKQDQLPLLTGLKFITFRETEFIGNPGNYTIRIQPAINFDGELFSLVSSFTVRPCYEPSVLNTFPGEKYPRCIPGLTLHNVFYAIIIF